jgi:hypothetical protein
MRRRTAKERREIVQEFRGSGLTQEAFARRRRISVGTLRSWIYRDDEVEEQREERFVEISGSAAMAGPEVVLRIGDQVVLELGELPAPEYLAELSRVLTC